MIVFGVLVGICYSVLIAAFGLLPALVLAIPILILYNIFAPNWKAIDYGEALMIAMVPIAALSFALGIYIGIPVVMISEQEWSEPRCYITHEIVNLSDNNEIKGEIHGGRRYVHGYIGEETVYHYYYTRPDGGFNPQKANDKNTVIYYTDDKPHADWYVQTRSYWNLSEEQYSVKIYIPNGSLSTEYVIDMN